MKRTRKSCASEGDLDDTPSKAAKLDESQVIVSDPTTTTASGSSDGVDDMVCFIDRLPDHLVVRIFQELETLREIAFTLPQVCKRWKQVALHENLWKDVFLCYESHMPQHQKNTFFKYLKMAPKLGGLTFELNFKDGREDFSKRIIEHCPNEVFVLQFVYDNAPPEAMFTLLLKYKHCLEKLVITDTYTPYVEDDVKRLWKEVMNLTKLKHLVIDGAALLNYKASFRKAAPCWKTLTILDVKDCSYEDMNTVQRLISVHSNWIEVYLSTTKSSIFRGEVKALSKCSKLETVQIPFCRELKFLEKCDMLDSIVIDCVDETSKEVGAVISSISKSSTFPLLKTLKIIGGGPEYNALLKSLVEVRDITLLNFVSCDITPDDLTVVLKKSHSLKSIYLHEMSAQCVSAVLKCISDNELPKLKNLNMVECYCDEESKLCLKLLVTKFEKHPIVKVTTDDTVCSCSP